MSCSEDNTKKTSGQADSIIFASADTAELLLSEGEIENAEVVLKSGFEQIRHLNSSPSDSVLGYWKSVLGVVYQELGRYRDAMDAYCEALTVLKRGGIHQGQIQAKTNMMLLLTDLGLYVYADSVFKTIKLSDYEAEDRQGRFDYYLNYSYNTLLYGYKLKKSGQDNEAREKFKESNRLLLEAKKYVEADVERINDYWLAKADYFVLNDDPGPALNILNLTIRYRSLTEEQINQFNYIKGNALLKTSKKDSVAFYLTRAYDSIYQSGSSGEMLTAADNLLDVFSYLDSSKVSGYRKENVRLAATIETHRNNIQLCAVPPPHNKSTVVWLVGLALLAAGLIGIAFLALRPVKIFVSYSQRNKKHLQMLATHFANSNSIKLIFDDKGIPQGGDITEFMISLSKADRVILLVSRQYFESRSCMLELLGIFEDCDKDAAVFKKRTIPILADDLNLHKEEDITSIKKHWQHRVETSKNNLRENLTDTGQRYFKQCETINVQIDDVIRILASIKMTPLKNESLRDIQLTIQKKRSIL